MQVIERVASPAAWQDERAVLRGLCHAFASAESVREAIAATPKWVRAALGIPGTSIRISIPDTGGRLRTAWADEGVPEAGRNRSARRRTVFVGRRPMRVALSTPQAGSTVAMLPLVSRGDCMGVLEVTAPSDAIAERWEPLHAIASQLAIVLRHLRRQERLRGELRAVRQAVSVGRSMSSAGSTEVALRAAARFVSEGFRAPVAVWCAPDDAPDLTLIDVRGVGSRKRRELRAALPPLPRGPRTSRAPQEAVATEFKRLLGGIDRVEIVDAGDAVMFVGVSDSAPSAPSGMVAGMLEEALRRRSPSAHPGAGRGHMGIAWTAHEMRGPLLAVKAALELTLLEGDDVNERDRERLSRSLDEVEQLAGIVDGLLAWGAGGQPLQRRAIDLVAFVDDVVRSCVHESGEDRVVLHAPASAMARVDPVHLRTALANIVRNALAFSSPGTKVEVFVEERDGALLLRIHNEGPAIPPGGPSLFDPFVRVDRDGRHASGRGLGLFIARRIVDAHGGAIWFESGEDGTTFFIRLAAHTRIER